MDGSTGFWRWLPGRRAAASAVSVPSSSRYKYLSQPLRKANLTRNESVCYGIAQSAQAADDEMMTGDCSGCSHSVVRWEWR